MTFPLEKRCQKGARFGRTERRRRNPKSRHFRHARHTKTELFYCAGQHFVKITVFLRRGVAAPLLGGKVTKRSPESLQNRGPKLQKRFRKRGPKKGADQVSSAGTFGAAWRNARGARGGKRRSVDRPPRSRLCVFGDFRQTKERKETLGELHARRLTRSAPT